MGIPPEALRSAKQPIYEKHLKPWPWVFTCLKSFVCIVRGAKKSPATRGNWAAFSFKPAIFWKCWEYLEDFQMSRSVRPWWSSSTARKFNPYGWPGLASVRNDFGTVQWSNCSLHHWSWSVLPTQENHESIYQLFHIASPWPNIYIYICIYIYTP